MIVQNACFINEDTIVYSCGRHLATLDLISKKMEFIRRDEEHVSEISCLSVGTSSKKELLIAIGEKMPDGTPRASIFVPNRMRWLYLVHDEEVLPEASRDAEILRVHLVHEKKYCVTVCKASAKSNLTVAFWSYNKEKFVKSFTLPRD